MISKVLTPSLLTAALLAAIGGRDVTDRDQQRARRGAVRLDKRTFADEGGPFLALGASLFWARWGFVHDRVRLERNLDYLAAHGVDYIRVLGVVGWPDRFIGAGDRDDSIAGLTDLAFDRYGLRVEWSIFGGIDSTPTPADREALTRRFIESLRDRREKVQAIEVGNESWTTGFGDKVDEAKALARLLRQTFPIVAVTSPPALTAGEIHRWYDGSDATLLTVHPPRDKSDASAIGRWRPVRHLCDPPGESPLAWSNDEGIGPESSVAWEDDPIKLTMYAAVTWLCGGAAFTLHTGAGVTGGGDGARPTATHPFQRSANVWEVSNIGATLTGINAVRALLPASLPNWSRHDANGRFPGYPFESATIAQLIERGQLVSAFAATDAQGRVIVIPVGISAPATFAPRSPMHIDVFDPLTGTRVASHDGPLTLTPRPAAILIGQPH